MTATERRSRRRSLRLMWRLMGLWFDRQFTSSEMSDTSHWSAKLENIRRLRAFAPPGKPPLKSKRA